MTLSIALAWLRKWAIWLLVGVLSVLLTVVWLCLRAAKRRETEAAMRAEMAKWRTAADLAYGQAVRQVQQGQLGVLEQDDQKLKDRLDQVAPPKSADGLSADEVVEELKRHGL